jgi:hypothetical protein
MTKAGIDFGSAMIDINPLERLTHAQPRIVFAVDNQHLAMIGKREP